MANYIKLSNQDILDKDFEVEYKGYKVEEVDSFLDMVAEDYKNFQEIISKKDEHINSLKNQVENLTEQLEKNLDFLESKDQLIDEMSKKALSNSAIIKRISELEKNSFNK